MDTQKADPGHGGGPYSTKRGSLPLTQQAGLTQSTLLVRALC